MSAGDIFASTTKFLEWIHKYICDDLIEIIHQWDACMSPLFFQEPYLYTEQK